MSAMEDHPRAKRESGIAESQQGVWSATSLRIYAALGVANLVIATSGKEHCAHMIAVEVRQGTLSSHHRSWGRGGRRGAEEEAEEKTTHIKSDNPHLTGGEKLPGL
eukprot:symbB.v1.2.024875.t1/scaffold2384.1/size81742/1